MSGRLLRGLRQDHQGHTTEIPSGLDALQYERVKAICQAAVVACQEIDSRRGSQGDREDEVADLAVCPREDVTAVVRWHRKTLAYLGPYLPESTVKGGSTGSGGPSIKPSGSMRKRREGLARIKFTPRAAERAQRHSARGGGTPNAEASTSTRANGRPARIKRTPRISQAVVPSVVEQARPSMGTALMASGAAEPLAEGMSAGVERDQGNSTGDEGVGEGEGVDMDWEPLEATHCAHEGAGQPQGPLSLAPWVAGSCSEGEGHFEFQWRIVKNTPDASREYQHHGDDGGADPAFHAPSWDQTAGPWHSVPLSSIVAGGAQIPYYHADIAAPHPSSALEEAAGRALVVYQPPLGLRLQSTGLPSAPTSGHVVQGHTSHAHGQAEGVWGPL